MPDEKRIKELVRRVVYRTVGRSPTRRRASLVTQADVLAAPERSAMRIPADALLTPLARQEAMDRRIRLEREGADSRYGGRDTESPPERTVALGADHGGFRLKEALKGWLEELDLRVLDCGAYSTESVDYPDLALAVASLVSQGRAGRGILVDGAGIGSCMVANKVPGVRAALCYDQATAINSREHNHANVLTLGAALIGEGLARQIVSTWLSTSAGEGRHARRVEKVMQVERRFLKDRNLG